MSPPSSGCKSPARAAYEPSHILSLQYLAWHGIIYSWQTFASKNIAFSPKFRRRRYLQLADKICAQYLIIVYKMYQIMDCYKEAARSLNLAAQEVRGSERFYDVTFIIQQCARCQQFLSQIVNEEMAPALKNAAEQLVEALSIQMRTLQRTQGAESSVTFPTPDASTVSSDSVKLENESDETDMTLQRTQGAGSSLTFPAQGGSTSSTPNVKSENESDATDRRNNPNCGPEKRARSNSVDDGEACDGRRKERYSAIEETIIEKGTLKFADVAGLHEAKRTLREAVIVPVQFPHLFTGGLEPWRRILLYGPPGTGKSYLAKAVSSEIDSTFYCVSTADIMSSWVGESEKIIKDLFHHAKNRGGKSVIFIDEVDSICRRRSSREEEHTRRVKTELLKQMEGVSSGHDDLFLMCATNCPWELDPAFLRRFQKRIYIPLPDVKARVGIMKQHAQTCSFSEEDWLALAECMDGYSGSDVATLTLGALFQPVRDLQVAQCWYYDVINDRYGPCSPSVPGHIKACMFDLPAPKVKPRAVDICDFYQALTNHNKTVTNDDLRRFDQFTKEFGSNG